MSESVKSARLALAEKRKLVAKTPVELRVEDSKQARSAEVVTFCREHLIKGGTWEELRYKLGLGPAWSDHRWRIVRSVVVEALLPANEEEALKAAESERQFLVSKLEEFVSEIEGRMDTLKGGKEEHHYWKIRLESLKIQLDQASQSFQNYTVMKKVKHLEKGTQGVSIIVQNNYHMARPGDSKKDVKDVTAKVTNLALEAKVAGSNNDTK